MADYLPGWLPDWLKEALSKPTMPVPTAGKAVGIESRSGSYDAARRGEIPTLEFGRKLQVPTAWVRRQLMLDEAPVSGSATQARPPTERPELPRRAAPRPARRFHPREHGAP